MFKFHKIGNEIAQGWHCLITSEKEMKAHLDHMARRVWRNWAIIKASPENKEGHCATQEAAGYKILLTMEMERRGIEKISFLDAIGYLTELATKSAIDTFARNGEVYVSRNGSCRPDTTIGLHESILEKTTRKEYTYPVVSKRDYSITKWPGGNHFYVMENGNSIPIDGKTKWNTVKAAQYALDWHWLAAGREQEKYGNT